MMHRRRTICFVLLAGASPALAAQASLHATLGARYTSTLVHDSIVTPFDVRPDVGPAIGGALDLPLSSPWKLEILVDLSTSPLRAHESSGSSATSITRLWMLGVAVGLRRRLEPWLEGRLAIGGLKYVPADRVGLFSDGTGGVIPWGAVAFDAAPAALSRRRLALELGADLHRFMTPALRNSGFVDSRVVYRVSAGLRADLRRGRAP